MTIPWRHAARRSRPSNRVSDARKLAQEHPHFHPQPKRLLSNGPEIQCPVRERRVVEQVRGIHTNDSRKRHTCPPLTRVNLDWSECGRRCVVDDDACRENLDRPLGRWVRRSWCWSDSCLRGTIRSEEHTSE